MLLTILFTKFYNILCFNESFNISRYVDITEPEPKIDVKEALAKLRKIERQRDEAKKKMDEYLSELGYE